MAQPLSDESVGGELWTIGAISSPTLSWGKVTAGNQHQCPYCGILLLTGERPGFCCGNHGTHLNDVPPLPPLPVQYSLIMQHPQISTLSHKLNLIFSFASMESTQAFPITQGPQSMVAVQGKLYH